MMGINVQRHTILSEISAKLAQMGIAYSRENGTDIAVAAEFLDAGWSTGNKRITYEAMIFADESANTVFMWEMTRETGQGFSFGGGSESSFQSGRTLFRKVKSVQYGPDGKAYEIKLDLGAIPKSVKETAKQFGWKFKTVLRRDKAAWPTGYMPPPVQQQQYSQPAQQAYAATPQYQQGFGAAGAAYGQDASPVHVSKNKSRKGGVLGLIGLLLMGIIMVLLLMEGEATSTGWIAAGTVFLVAFIIQRLLSRRGCIINLILWILAGFSLLLVLAFTTDGSLNFTTAHLKNAHMTTTMGSDGKPVDKINTYSVDAPELVAAAELRNAPPDTKVRFVWIYVTENINITEFTMDNGDKGSDIHVFSCLTNDKPWPEGKYKVEMYIEDRQTPDSVVEFQVAGVTGAMAGDAEAAQTGTGTEAVKPGNDISSRLDGKWVSSSGKVTDVLELDGEEEASLMRAFKEDEDSLAAARFGFTIEGGLWSQVFFYDTALAGVSANVGYEEGKVEFVSKDLQYSDGSKQRFELVLAESDGKLKGTLSVVYDDANGTKTAVLDVEFIRSK